MAGEGSQDGGSSPKRPWHEPFFWPGVTAATTLKIVAGIFLLSAGLFSVGSNPTATATAPPSEEEEEDVATVTVEPEPTETPTPPPTPTFTPAPPAAAAPVAQATGAPTQAPAFAPVTVTSTINVTSTLQSYTNCPAAFVAINPPIGSVTTGASVYTIVSTSPTAGNVSSQSNFAGTANLVTRVVTVARTDSPTARRDSTYNFDPTWTNASGVSHLITVIDGADCIMTFAFVATANPRAWQP